ncbi:MAG: AEC family transporter [Clostridiales bacterium]|nr:AEC family transporter [Clostridiales bacterium]
MGEIYLKAMIVTLVLLLFAVPGFALKKLNMIGDDGKKTLSNILLYVCQPAMILAAFTVFTDDEYAEILATPRTDLLAGFGISAAVALLALVAVYGLCRLIFIKHKNRDAADVYTFIAMFSNCGFLGVPFIKMFTGGSAVAVMYIMVFNIVFVVLIWTLGVYLITHDRKDISAKKVLINPTIIASAVALIMFFVPQINFFMMDGVRELSTIPSALSTMTAPLAMMLVGVALAELPIKNIFTNPSAYVAGALRLIVAPLLTLGIAVVFYEMTAGYMGSLGGNADYIFLAPVIAMAMSPASTVVAMIEHYGGEKELSVAAYVNNTLLSVITVPLVVMAVMEIWKFV